MLPTTLLSGFAFPIDQMPVFVQGVTYLVSARYYVTILKSVFLKGAGAGELAVPMLCLALYAAGPGGAGRALLPQDAGLRRHVPAHHRTADQGVSANSGGTARRVSACWCPRSSRWCCSATRPRSRCSTFPRRCWTRTIRQESRALIAAFVQQQPLQGDDGRQTQPRRSAGRGREQRRAGRDRGAAGFRRAAAQGADLAAAGPGGRHQFEYRADRARLRRRDRRVVRAGLRARPGAAHRPRAGPAAGAGQHGRSAIGTTRT